MNEKMRALVLTQYNHLEIQVVEKPLPEDDEVLIRIRSCAICGSDIHGMDGGSGRRIPPIIMGHEAAGDIVAIGKNVENLSLGQRVTFDSTEYCTQCQYCGKKDINLCDARKVFGVSCGDYRKHGAMAEYLAVKSYLVYPLPDNVTYDQAALVEPLSVAIHAVKRLNDVKKDMQAAVIGTGTIGLLIIAVLKAYGVKTVIAADVIDAKLETAIAFGADYVVNTRDMDEALSHISKITGKDGVDVSFEAVGIEPTALFSLNCIKKGGSTVWVGNVSPQVNMPLQHIVTRQISIFGSCASAGEYDEALELISKGSVDVGKLISATIPLEEGSAWFHRLHSGKEPLLKVVLNP